MTTVTMLFISQLSCNLSRALHLHTQVIIFSTITTASSSTHVTRTKTDATTTTSPKDTKEAGGTPVIGALAAMLDIAVIFNTGAMAAIQLLLTRT